MPGNKKRSRYRPSWRVDWRKFLPLMAFALLCAVAFAWGLNALYTRGWYWSVVVPVLAASLLSGLVRLAIGAGRCRFPLLAGLSGLIAGVVMYGGFYYIGMISYLGTENAARIDLLPRYIQLRMRMDVQHNLEAPDAPALSRRPDPVFNWIIFSFELGTVLFITTVFSYRRACRAFCENCAQWKLQQVVKLPPGHGKTIAEWLERGELGQLASVQIITPELRQSHTSVAVELCPAAQALQPCAVYLAVKEVSKRGATGSSFDASIGKMQLRRIELTPQEVEAITPMFPQLTVGASAASTASTSASLIEVWPVPEPEAGTIMNARSILIGNLLGLIILVVFYASLIGMYAGWRLPIAPGDSLGTARRAAISVACLILAGLSGYIGLKNPSVIGNTYYLWKAKRAVSRRQDKIVDPENTADLPTFFVEIVPRKNWGKVMIETASDIGFLQIDHNTSEIRFEGDKERYNIPGEAIERCTVERLSVAGGKIVHYLALVRGQSSEGPWEAPFCYRQTSWRVPANHRELSGQMLCAHICSIMPTAQVQGSDVLNVDAEADPAAPAASRVDKPTRSRILTPRLIITLLVIGFAVLNRFNLLHHPPRINPQRNYSVEVGGSDAALPLRITDVRVDQALTDSPPYASPGGDWTVFDCALADDSAPCLTVAVHTPQPPNGQPFSFSQVEIIPGDRPSGGRLVAALAAALHETAPPAPTTQPLLPTKWNNVVLGSNLSDPQHGLKTGGGSWVASKWFIQNQSLDAELYFNYDLTTRRAELSREDSDYDADTLVGIAAAVRDGPRPPRSPDNDPNFTLNGPSVADLRLIPGSKSYHADYAGGGKLLTLTNGEPGAPALGVPLENPQSPIILARLSGSIARICLADPDGNRLLLSERTHESSPLMPVGRTRLWWINRTGHSQTELTGPWGQFAQPNAQTPISPDGRYAVIRGIDGTLLDQKRSTAIYVVQLDTGKSVKVAIPNCYVDGWTGAASQPRAIAFKRNDSGDSAPRQSVLIDPSTGAPAPDADWRAPDPTISPDGRLKLVLNPHVDVKIVTLATGTSRTFSFNQEDQRFGEPYNLRWLNSRYLLFVTHKQGFIDVATMKMGYLPTFDLEKDPTNFAYSPDFKWAVMEGADGVRLGRVVEPPQ